MVVSAVHPDAELRLPGVGVNPTRAGIIEALREMGADIAVEEERVVGGEPVGDIVVRSSELHGITVAGDTIPRLIDEIPALAVAAAFASGRTVIRDARELRVKESDRIASVASQLSRLGVKIEELDDGMIIEGGHSIDGGDVESMADHRLAMALAIAGLAAQKPIRLSDGDAVSISYPMFWEHLQQASQS
jgi:3-phosphoshikimate 1-carboxyvinyltransferase